MSGYLEFSLHRLQLALTPEPVDIRANADALIEQAAATLVLSASEAAPGSPVARIADFTGRILADRARAKAQLYQDLWVLHETGGQTGGFFVEVGAANGVDMSNTFLLETGFGWTGILAEPDPRVHASIRAHRSAALSTECVTDRTGETVRFRCAKVGIFSTISDFVEADNHADAQRKDGYEDIDVPTVSLNDLLARHDAPNDITYLSVDTEGSELLILSALDFERWSPRLITVEHNYTPARDALHALLTDKGYARVFERFSLWDSWYVRQDAAASDLAPA